MAKIAGYPLLILTLVLNIGACLPRTGIETPIPDEPAQEDSIAHEDPVQDLRNPQEPQIQDPPAAPTPTLSERETLAKVFQAEIGVRETEGNNRGPRIREYMKSVGLSDGYAWCAGFVKFCFETAGIDTPGANAWSPSWFPSGKTTWKQGAKHEPSPKQGDVFGIYFPNLGRIGHVGFVDEYHGGHLITVEGNTNDGGSREGDSVMRRRRISKQIHSFSDWIDK